MYDSREQIRFIDLFCGIGGFRIAFEEACEEQDINAKCVFSSDIDKYAQDSYEANFGERPHGDITQIDEKDIPDHDILFAGFPCQPFSIIGQMKGLNDTRGTLFFDIARIIKEKEPKSFILENVKQLVGHDKGNTLKVILKSLKDLGYHVQYSVLNALDYGLPQKRERIVIVGHKEPIMFTYPDPIKPFKPLTEILETKVNEKHFASDYIKNKRKESHKSSFYPSIWHENKSGNISSYPFSCALRAGASYNYLLVNGERRLTPREMHRLQGFPDWFKIVVSDGQAKRQAGNAVPVNMIKAVVQKLLPYVATSLDQAAVLREYDLKFNPS
ncbi:DNA cytosine methyltransferase [Flagellimonas nanhaiensis]|uniref:Cytosine-specific methyltransferase n=1 Tax=Flagellimonas nanhaiensis TaxID=2292706 RepID=A0A371JPT1_9FLAO|nr:DNA (cytosine-5-)-methyltransferase [Allomuricauda nanhaiensis]RDY59443.1 DNA (cytosine-5-)-methyltransferase [Allomuricauda nanhaiensis]